MSKKNRFLISSIILTFALTLIPRFSHYGLWAILAFTFLGLFFAIISLWSDLHGIEFITLTTLPIFFSLGMASMLFNFPNFSSFFKLVFLLTFLIFYYSLLLALNVFNVARLKTIPLLRAAYTVSFLITVFSALPVFTILYKSSVSLPWEILWVGLISLGLGFQSLWTVFLPERNDGGALGASWVVSLLMMEVALVFSFYPLESFFRSLTLATFFYICLGFAHQYLRRALNVRSVLEYAAVALTIVVIVVLF